jgi:hypothetical protein
MADTLAYNETVKITAVKSVKVLAPGVYHRVEQMKGVSLS